MDENPEVSTRHVDKDLLSYYIVIKEKKMNLTEDQIKEFLKLKAKYADQNLTGEFVSKNRELINKLSEWLNL